MTDIAMAACPFCKSTTAEVLAVEIDLYAGVCRACGAHGPVRVLGPKQLVECVKAQAAHDWNQAAIQDSTRASGFDLLDEIAGSLGSRCHALVSAMAEDLDRYSGQDVKQLNSNTTPEKAPTEAADSSQFSTSRAARMAESLDGWPDGRKTPDPVDQQVPETAGSGGGQGTPVSNFPESPSTELADALQPASPRGLESDAPAGGGAKDRSKQISSRQLEAGDRLARFLGDIGMSAETACNRGMKFGTSKATLYKILKGIPAKACTIGAVNNALNKLERGRKLSGAAHAAELTKPAQTQPVQLQTDYDESVIEKLPHKFAEPNGMNRSPGPVAPPRHARTP